MHLLSRHSPVMFMYILKGKMKLEKIPLILMIIISANVTVCINGHTERAKQCQESSCEPRSHKDCTLQCVRMNLTDGLPKINPLVKVLKIRDSLMPTIKSYRYGTLDALDKIYIIASNVTYVNNDAFDRMPNIRVLHIERNNIPTVLNAGFNLEHLSELSLMDNNISKIKFTLTKSDKDKIEIRLSHNPIKNIPFKLFSGFKGIKTVSLYLRDIGITQLDNNTFDGINVLHTLNISDNFLGRNGFHNIANSVQGKMVKSLQAVNCSMKSLKRESFKKVCHVEQLDLSHNLWETWPVHSLSYLKNLSSLKINNCPSFAFFKASNEIRNVKYLSLHSNALLQSETIGTIFNKSQKLEYLNISDNHFQDRVKRISTLKSLKVFDMSNNHYPLIKERVYYFESMPNLRTFNMRNVYSKYQEDEGDFDLGVVALTNMTYLQNLDLSHNSAVLREEYIRSSYSGLTSLTKVDLSYNTLQDCYSAMMILFKFFKSVKILNLSGNSLPDMQFELLFESMTNLTDLHLERNRLTYFSKKYLKKNLKMERLYLQSNSIRWIDGSAFVYLQNLRFLNITYNTFLCDCDLRGFRDWLKLSKKGLVSGRDQTCVRPSAMKIYKITSFEMPWIKCDDMWIILIVIIVTICVILGILLAYFRWDIKYWWMLGRSRRRRRNGYTAINGDMGGRYPFDGFVSYNSESQDWVVDHMLPNMERSPDEVNFKICFDGRDFIPGKYIADNIVDSIHQSRKLIFVITEKFIKSQWCGFELEMANLRQFDEKRNLVVLIFLEAIPKKKLPRKIRLLMKHMTYIEWDKENARAQKLFWKKLKLCMMDEPADLLFGQNP
ncbi:unnamed protein product [Owenia fusiformis]|uniref:Uncharacterized protein n=1 Tax=Owenia fusiformis TaxID=6347 RepID=A0A8J1TVP8_OWEFU|nr:unnamed protein product [Owenia fusiformis]